MDELTSAIEHDTDESIKILSKLDPGHINDLDSFGFSPLHVAVVFENYNILDVLFKTKFIKIINLNLQNHDGNTALHLACQRGYMDIIKYLLEHDFSSIIHLNVQNKDGNTPLHEAYLHGFYNVCKLLMNVKNYTVDLTIQNNNGKTIHDLDTQFKLKDDDPIPIDMLPVYTVEGHSCDTGVTYKIPPNCIYVTIGICGTSSTTDDTWVIKFYDLFKNSHMYLKNPVLYRKELSLELGVPIHIHSDTTDNTYMDCEYSLFSFWEDRDCVSTSGLYKIGIDLQSRKIMYDVSREHVPEELLEIIYQDSILPMRLVENTSFDNLEQTSIYRQSYLFDTLPGIYYNLLCRVPCLKKNKPQLDQRRRHSFAQDSIYEKIKMEGFTPSTKEEILHAIKIYLMRDEVYPPINQWNVSNLHDMERLFEDSDFNEDISNWDVSHVTTMKAMFYKALKFNQNISNWNVSHVQNMQSMFHEARDFNGNISNWDVRHVTNMKQMFFKATNFNQDISGWDVSKVTTMNGMFFGATLFNQNLTTWKKAMDMTNFKDSPLFTSIPSRGGTRKRKRYKNKSRYKVR